MELNSTFVELTYNFHATERRRLSFAIQILVKGQREVLTAIRILINEHEIPPIQQEIADMMGISHTTVKSHLDALKRKGYITWDEGRPRTIRILKE